MNHHLTLLYAYLVLAGSGKQWEILPSQQIRKYEVKLVSLYYALYNEEQPQ